METGNGNINGLCESMNIKCSTLGNIGIKDECVGYCHDTFF